MLEYVFFQELPRKRFQKFLKEQGLLWTLEFGDMETLVVIDDAGVDHELADRIESTYDELFAMDQATYGSIAAGSVDLDSEEGVAVRLESGHTVIADVPPELVSRVLTAISPEELRIFVDSVARAVETADSQDL
jgi:hypothetical protein